MHIALVEKNKVVSKTLSPKTWNIWKNSNMKQKKVNNTRSQGTQGEPIGRENTQVSTYSTSTGLRKSSHQYMEGNTQQL